MNYGTVMIEPNASPGGTAIAHRAALHFSHDETTRSHQLPMMRIVLPVDGWVEIQSAGERQRYDRALWTPPDITCVVAGYGRSLTLFVDPLSPLCRCEAPRAKTLAALQAAAREVRQLERDAEGFILEAEHLLLTARRPVDPRVVRAAGWLADNPTAPWSMKRLSARVRLSPSRLAHLFQSEVGVSARSLARLNRTLAALKFMARGMSLVETTYAAGFSDQAHLTRSCVDLLGQSPSHIRDSRIIQA